MMKLITVLLLLFGYSKAEYSDAFARQLAHPVAIDAYNNKVGDCIRNTLGDNDVSNVCDFKITEHINYVNSYLFQFGGQFTVNCDEKNQTCSGFVVAHPASKYVIISFRGSTDQGSPSFISYNIFKVILSAEINEAANESLTHPMVSFVGGGKINYFFNNAFNVLWNAGIKDAFLTLKNKYPDYQVLITGHSLGGAEAIICAGTISYLKYVDSSKIRLITFGSPRIGDKAFADAIAKLVPEPYRVVHRNDIVPHLPIEGLFGYTHIASEIW